MDGKDVALGDIHKMIRIISRPGGTTGKKVSPRWNGEDQNSIPDK